MAFRVSVLGRTKTLLSSAKLLHQAGFSIPLIGTCRSEPYYDVKEADFEKFAAEIGAEFFMDSNLGKPERIRQLRKAECDIGISVNWISIIQKESLDCFKYGILNAHAGDLPRFRGNACPNWAILNDEKSVGLTIHAMNAAELDSGPIFQKEHFALTPKTYINEVYTWIESRVPELFLAAVRGVADGRLTGKIQDTKRTPPLRCYPRRPEDSRIQWDRPAEEILRLIRASSHPFSGAYSSFEANEKVTIWRAELFEHPGDFLAVPGQILMIHEGCPVIACDRSCLRLTEFSVGGHEGSNNGNKILFKSLRNRMI